MNGGIVDIDLWRRAREESAAIRAKYDIEQNRREIDALMSNRRERLKLLRRTTNRSSLAIAATCLLAGSVIGLALNSSSVRGGRQGQARAIEQPLAAAQPPPAADAILEVIPKATPIAAAVEKSRASVATKPLRTSRDVPARSAQVASSLVPTATAKKDSQWSYEAPAKAFTSGAPSPEPVKPVMRGLQAADSPVPSQFTVIGVPSDGLVTIQRSGDPAIRYVKVGEQLPNGAKVVKATADSGIVETDRGRLVFVDR